MTRTHPRKNPFYISISVLLSHYGKTSAMGWLRLVGSFKNIGLFCKSAWQTRPWPVFCKRDIYSAKETYVFKEPTNGSPPIPFPLPHMHAGLDLHWPILPIFSTCIGKGGTPGGGFYYQNTARKSSWLKSGVDPPIKKQSDIDPGSPILLQFQNAL